MSCLPFLMYVMVEKTSISFFYTALHAVLNNLLQKIYKSSVFRSHVFKCLSHRRDVALTSLPKLQYNIPELRYFLCMYLV